MSELTHDSFNYYLFTDIDDHSAKDFCEWLAVKEPLAPTVLRVYINSFGGSVHCSIAMVNAMKSSQHTIYTIATGSIMSAAVSIFIAGDIRLAYSDADFMTHQFATSTGYNKYHELKESQEWFKRLHEHGVQFYQNESTKRLSKKKIAKELLRETDTYLSAYDMYEWGFVDQVVDINVKRKRNV